MENCIMAMSDCANCWDTPCTCGYDYTDRDLKYIDDLIQTLQWVKSTREASPLKGRQRYLTPQERQAFRDRYPNTKMPYSLNQLTQEQLDFIQALTG
jgi:hypothetical protein